MLFAFFGNWNTLTAIISNTHISPTHRDLSMSSCWNQNMCIAQMWTVNKSLRNHENQTYCESSSQCFFKKNKTNVSYLKIRWSDISLSKWQCVSSASKSTQHYCVNISSECVMTHPKIKHTAFTYYNHRHINVCY